MFSDACFPYSNEIRFIDVSGLFGMKLLFIYPNRKKASELFEKNRTHNALFGFFEKKHDFFEEISVLGREQKFCYIPDLRVPITQVQIKELSVLLIPLLLQVGQLKSISSREFARKLSFVSELCRKYHVKIIPISAAKDPFSIIPKKELESLIATI